MNDSLVWMLFLFLFPIPILAYFGKKHSQPNCRFGGRNYNRWLIGLSAGATGNTGFIMTGAVGLGYAYGIHWIFLPIAWLMGDLFFWSSGPRKIQGFSSTNNTSSILDIIADKNGCVSGKTLWWVVLAISVFLLGTYVSSQWIAGTKILQPVFQLPRETIVLLLGAFVILYSILGGFRGSVYTDIYQATLMIFVTVLSLILVLNRLSEASNFGQGLPEGFLKIFGDMTIYSIMAFIIGWSAAAVGFGFGQPQILSRYMSGKDEKEIGGAKWVYIGFLQFTWIGMTLFGVLLRSINFEVSDREGSLIEFVKSYDVPLLSGLVVAGILAAITSTVDSILIAISGMCNPIYSSFSERSKATAEKSIILLIGGITVIVALWATGSVFEIAVFAISMIGGTFAAPVIIKVYSWISSPASLLTAVIFSAVSCLLWRYLEFNLIINEAIVGISVGLIVNYLVVRGPHYSRV